MSNEEQVTTPEAQPNNKELEEKEAVELSDADNGKAAQQVEAVVAETTATTPAKEQQQQPGRPVKPPVHKVDFEKDVVYLYQFSRTANTPSPSCFCLKVETWLRICGIKYENVDHKSKFRSSKGQLPFVELNGEEIADSAVIIKELGRHFDKDLDSQLTPEQRNVAHATTTMLENHFHWIELWWRTKNPDAFLQGYKIDLQHMIGSKLPVGLLKMVYRLTFRRRGLKKVRATGIGVHSAEEIIQMGKDDLQVLTDMLGNKEYFFGDHPTTLDAVVFSNVAQLIVVEKEVEHPLRDWCLENCKNLVDHFNRIKEKYYPDWDEMCSTLSMNTHLPKPVLEIKEEKEADKDKEKGEEEKKEELKEKIEDEKEKEKEMDEKKVEEAVDENKQKETN